MRQEPRDGRLKERWPVADRKNPRSISRKITTGFALMSLVPILLAVYLVSRPDFDGSATWSGAQGIILLLMVGSALSGFYFIKAELARTFLGILEQASRNATNDLVDRVREASEGEIGKIAEAIANLTCRLETASSSAERSKTRFQQGLRRVAEGLQTSRETAQLLGFLAEGAVQAVDARTSYVMGVDEAGGDFVTRSAAGEDADKVRGRRIPLGEGIPGLAARERKPLLLQDLAGIAEGATGPGLTRGPESTVATPLFQGETLHGVLVVHDRQDGEPFDEADLEVVANLASVTVAALCQREARVRLEEGFDHVIRAFAIAVEERDPYARGHALRVARYCEEMGRSLRLDEETLRSLRRAALLHAVGKISLPDSVLHKEGFYTDEELEHVRGYPQKSEEILRDVQALAPVRPMVRHHLERLDGSGFPDGIRGDEIPLPTHILIVANAFDAMTSDRSFRKAMSVADAFRELQKGAGKVFDRRAVHALVGLDRNVLKATHDVTGDGAGVRGKGTASVSVRK